MKNRDSEIKNTGCIFIVSGTSSVGKSTVCRAVRDYNESLPIAEGVEIEFWGHDDQIIQNRGLPKDKKESVAMHAVDAIKRGNSIILDLGLSGRTQEKFFPELDDLLESENISCPIIRSCMYLPIDQIAQRALERGDRPGMGAHLNSHFFAFSIVNDNARGKALDIEESIIFNDCKVGDLLLNQTVARSDIERVIAKVDGEDFVQQTQSFISTLMTKLAPAQGNEFNVLGLKIDFDKVYYAKDEEATALIAQDIISSIKEKVRGCNKEALPRPPSPLGATKLSGAVNEIGIL